MIKTKKEKLRYLCYKIKIEYELMVHFFFLNFYNHSRMYLTFQESIIGRFLREQI